MSKVGLESPPKEEACQRCRELGFDNSFASLGDKETHGKLHLVVDYELPNPPPSTELMRQIMDSCFPCQGDQEENPADSSATGLGHAILLIPKEEPMEAGNEEPTGSSPSDQEEKPILDECLMCGFRCFGSERLEQHWSHVARKHLETPGIFGCSQCQRTWDSPEPFREHLLIHRLWQQASLLDLRDLDACNIFQICFGVSEERLAAAELGHLFQTPVEQMAPHPTEPLPPHRPRKTKDKREPQKELEKKALDRCLQKKPKKKQNKAKFRRTCSLCEYKLPRGQESRQRWVHVSQKHADGMHLFYCALCKKGAKLEGNVTYYCKKNHPRKKVVVDNRKELNELHQRCFLIAST